MITVETLEIILPSLKQIEKLLQDRGSRSHLSVKLLNTEPYLKVCNFFNTQSSEQFVINYLVNLHNINIVSTFLNRAARDVIAILQQKWGNCASGAASFFLALSKCQYQDLKTELLGSSSQDNIQNTISLSMLHENRIKITPVSSTLYYVYPFSLKIFHVTLSNLNEKELLSESERTKYSTHQGHTLSSFITPALHHLLNQIPCRLTSGEILAFADLLLLACNNIKVI